MNQVKVHCRTNIDCVKREPWPTELPCRPMKGDLIRSLYKRTNGHVELAVVACTFIKSHFTDEIILEVELHLPSSRFENIPAFEKWYKSL